MASAPINKMSLRRKCVSRFKGDAELKSPIRATIVEAHNRNKLALSHITNKLKEPFLSNIMKIIKDNIIDDTGNIKIDPSSKEINFKSIEKQIREEQELYSKRLYSKLLPHLEKNRNTFMNKIFMFQHSYAIKNLIDEISENDITMINDYLEDDETLIDKYEKAEEFEEQQHIDIFNQLINGNCDDNEDENINLPSFMTGSDSPYNINDDEGLYNGMDSDNPPCDSDDGDCCDNDDPPIDYEEYFERFLNNGLTDELNLDNPQSDNDNDSNIDDDETNIDAEKEISIGGCQGGCDCSDSCSIKVMYKKEDLLKFKIGEIKSIAKTLDIKMKKSKVSKTKQQLINEIIKTQN